MADSNDEDRSDTLSAPDPDRPGFEPPEPDRARPPSPGKASTAKRPAVWGAAVAVVAVGAVITGVMVSKGNAPHDRPSPGNSSPAPKRPPNLPLSAVHDNHGMIVTLPDIRRILGPTPLPGVTLSNNQLDDSPLGGIKVTTETNRGFTDSASQYRSLDVTLIRFPSVESIKHTYGKVGPGPHREDSHHWAGPSMHIARLGGPGIVYEFSNGPFEARIPDKKVDFDYIGPVVEARYRNVMIRISFRSADFKRSRDGKIKAVYPSYTKTRNELIAITRNLIGHL